MSCVESLHQNTPFNISYERRSKAGERLYTYSSDTPTAHWEAKENRKLQVKSEFQMHSYKDIQQRQVNKEIQSKKNTNS